LFFIFGLLHIKREIRVAHTMMIFLIIGGIISLLTAAIGVLIALRIQLSLLAEKHVEREAWEHAQESHQLAWEARQRKHSLEVERELRGNVKQIQEEWQQWEARIKDHTQKLSQEYALNTLPKVDETPLSLDGHHHVTHAPTNWHPPTFYQADLRERDFSHRYLGQANFRDAQLGGANFYMADLRDACLAGANLAGANLIGANLTDADLRGANLSGANLLVTDLRDAILYGANLLHVRNLTTQQIYDTTYDHTTQLDPEIDITMARLPATPMKIVGTSISPELMKLALESPFLSPPASGDNRQDQGVEGAVPPTNRPENTHTGGIDTAIPRIGQNGIRRARVS
jgi:Pentapeptide repeats (8 copies)